MSPWIRHSLVPLVLACALLGAATVAAASTTDDDPLAPLVVVESTPGEGVAGPQTIKVTVTDAGGSGIASVHYSVDSYAEETYASAFSLSRPGRHVVTAWAFDNAARRGEAVKGVDVTTESAVRSTPIQGPDRIITAIEASKRAFKTQLVPDSEGYTTVVLATGFNWPDALGAATLAGAVDGPILLTKAAVLPTQVAAEMVRLGADRVLVVGGTSAVSKAVADTCLMVPGIDEVERIAGADRYKTAILIAERARALRGSTANGVGFIATGGDYPDALGASAVAAAHGAPVFLAPPGTSLRADVADALVEAGIDQPVILGGTKAVSTGVAQGIQAATGTVPLRLAGSNRYGTALELAAWAVENQLLYWDGSALATGLGYADAISGGALQGRSRSVLLLTDPETLDPAVESLLGANRRFISEVRFLGGEAVLSPSVRDAALLAVDK